MLQDGPNGICLQLFTIIPFFIIIGIKQLISFLLLHFNHLAFSRKKGKSSQLQFFWVISLLNNDIFVSVSVEREKRDRS